MNDERRRLSSKD
jgi:hypothetical protein